jgi:hypothetical protein
MGELLKPHQDPDGKVTQPRWVKCWEMVAGAHPGHPAEPSGIVYDQTSDGVSLDEMERVVF